MYDMIVAILLMFYYFNFQKIVYNKHMIRKWRLDTLTLGVYRGQVVLSDYQDAWVNDFEQVKQDIIKATDIESNDIQHIGSISIPGLAAKPIIDILIGVEDYKSMPKSFYDALITIGIFRLRVERADEIVLAKFEGDSFQKHTCFIHLVSKEQQKWTDLLKFRDYLRSNPDARYEYQHLKEYLSIQYPDNRAKYTQEKEAFVNSILNK